MAPLIFLIVTLVLFAAYLAFISWEGARGTRLFAGTRAELDMKVEQTLFVVNHVDFNAFVRTEVEAALLRLGHFIAHVTLQSVRSVERFLTRTVRHLRNRVAVDAATPKETSRPFVQALGDFKEELKAIRPDAPPEF